MKKFNVFTPHGLAQIEAQGFYVTMNTLIFTVEKRDVAVFSGGNWAYVVEVKS